MSGFGGFGSGNGGGGGFGSQGWDIDDVGGGKQYSDNKEFGPRKFWMPASATKRVMFLDGNPFCFYEHGLYSVNKSKDSVTCLKKNGIDEGKGCPLCEAEMWPSFIGYFSVIDMGDVTRKSDGSVKLTGWTSKKGVTYQFGKSLFGAKRGGADKPGVLKKLQRLSQKHGGDLTGTVWDIYRSGAKVESVGDEFEFVEKVSVKDFKDYFIDLGAADNLLDLKPFDYQTVFAPKTYDAIKRIVGDKPTFDDNSEY